MLREQFHRLCGLLFFTRLNELFRFSLKESVTGADLSKNIASIIENLSKIADTIIVCNDGSSDNTGRIAEKMGAIVINHERNLGYGAAIRSLFLRARELGSDVLVTMDSDGQHRISDVLPGLKYNYRNL